MLPPSLVSFKNLFVIHIFLVLSLFAKTLRIPRVNTSILLSLQTVFTLIDLKAVATIKSGTTGGGTPATPI